MKKVLITSLVGLVLASGAFAAGEECTTKQECPVATKVNTLLVRWETAAEEAKAMTSEQHEALATQVAALTSKCPVGSRMKDTLSAVNDVIGFVAATNAANAEHCPLESADHDSADFASAKQLKAARCELLGNLGKLASYASGACCSESEAKAVANEDCADDSHCPIRMASRIGELKASFADARQEAAALTPETRAELQAGFQSLSETSKAVALMPESFVALAEGLESLGKLNGEMVEFAKTKPELMAKLPASVHHAFMMEVSLIDEARELLASASEAMTEMTPSTETAMR